MRGAGPVPVSLWASLRITPADAGSSAASNGISANSTDHPRGCGEQEQETRKMDKETGSPPRMRGAAAVRRPDDTGCRITPADAGSSFHHHQHSIYYPDHPRGCGEQDSVSHGWLSCGGSPPRMRGAERVCRRPECHRGITPADAGSSTNSYHRPNCPEDHPRGCGEQHVANLFAKILTGSPPRMRGAGWRVCAGRCRRRITPADAGSSSWSDRPSFEVTDHPRGCGEQTKKS